MKWISCKESKPSDMAVLVLLWKEEIPEEEREEGDSDSPVETICLGYYSDNKWFSSDDEEIEPDYYLELLQSPYSPYKKYGFFNN